MNLPPVSRLTPLDLARLGLVGARIRPARTVLAALGIAIGIAALVALLGIPAANQAHLRRQLAALGPNLLTVAPGNDITTGRRAVLPAESIAMTRRIAPVRSVSALGSTGAHVYRTDRMPADRTGGLAVTAARLDLLDTLHGAVLSGRFLDAASERYPVTVLGWHAARILGVELTPGRPAPRVWIGGQWFAVAGVLQQLPLAAAVDYAALVGWPAAEAYLGFDGTPGTLFVRVDDAAVADVRAVLARTVNPRRPDLALVSQPSEALAAQQAVEGAYSGLLLGLGAVALLVGGIGVANTMVISVLERRREIGLRRALGATRRQIGGQFLAESLVLTGLGGLAGVLLGTAVTVGFAIAQGWPTVLPLAALAGTAGIAVAVGVLAGVYPAVRAARLSPTQALSSA